ncbi:MAG: outer membrane beta-barrel protein, partial [Nitrospiraceae bacterium]
MKQPTWAGVRAIVLAVTALFLLPLQAQAERNWEFSAGVFGGKAYHSNENMKYSDGQGGVVIAGTAHGVTLNDAPTFGGKLTAWHLPRLYKWQPQIGLELDWTRFTADLHPQTVGAEGTVSVPGFELGSVTFLAPIDFSVNVLAANLLFRYPIGATPEMPQGRWYPYVGGGLGAQRASMTFSGFQETSYSPAVQGLVGAKFFLIKNLAIFAEVKRTTGWNEFDFEGSGAPPGFSSKFTISSNHIVAGVALHF